jgi:hypothetical protein
MAPNHESATKALIIALMATEMRTFDIYAITSISQRTIQSIFINAIKRGFDPNLRPMVLLNKYVDEAPRSSRPQKQTPKTKNLVVSKVRTDRA